MQAGGSSLSTVNQLHLDPSLFAANATPTSSLIANASTEVTSMVGDPTDSARADPQGWRTDDDAEATRVSSSTSVCGALGSGSAVNLDSEEDAVSKAARKRAKNGEGIRSKGKRASSLALSGSDQTG